MALFQIPYSGDIRIDSLIGNSATILLYSNPVPRTLFYSFDVTDFAKSGPFLGIATNVTPLSAAWQAKAREVFAQAEEITGIDFEEVATAAQADYRFAVTDTLGLGTSGAEAAAKFGGGGWVAIQTQTAAGAQGAGSFLFHEIGHTLGLSHPFDDSAHKLPAAQDNYSNTVMTYTVGTPRNEGFQDYDLRALYYLYGADGFGGTYGYNSVKGPTMEGYDTWLLTHDYSVAIATSFSPAMQVGGGLAVASKGTEDIVLTFSKPITAAGGTLSIKIAPSGYTVQKLDVLASPNIKVNGNTLTISHTQFSEGTMYVLDFAPGAFKDTGGKDARGSEYLSGYAITVPKSTDPVPIIRGEANRDLVGTYRADNLNAGLGNNTLTGGGGDDRLTGHYAGFNSITTAKYAAERSWYKVTSYSGTDYLQLGVDASKTGEGVDSLQAVSRLKFSDMSLAFDLKATQNAGEAALLVGSVIGVGALTTNPAIVGAALAMFDNHYTMRQACDLVMNMPELAAVAGGSSNAALAKYLLTNVLGQTPADSSVNLVSQYMTDFGKGAALEFMTTHEINQTHINLVGLSTVGLGYV